MNEVKDCSLILEGGTFRTVFTAGVLDALMEQKIVMPYIAAISAGAINAVSYMSNQPERTMRVLTTYRNDPRYMGARNFLKEKSLFGLDFAYNIVPNQLDLFDWDAYYNYPGEVEFGLTNAFTGKVEYKSAHTMTRTCDILQATCAIPVLFPEIKIDNIPYYDGGLADSIPVKRAIEKGYSKHLLVLTREPGYIKQPSRSNKWATKLFQKRYPRLAAAMNDRATMYNDTMKYIGELEQNNEAFIFKPDRAIKSFESKIDQMKANYEVGYEQALKQMPELKEFLGVQKDTPIPL
ncbi:MULTISPECIES: patatin-like phospholipase family protein [Solibacillus]|uniref:Patatin family protein n=1 Tax=Solibacillus merdavium TaxID=2762218 RepID=A0ABR8XK70_9BACL|nr:patatin family protein [Solibacillus merdavium]MBD8032329.1 patatin family protein [Solibacillus merdavium]